MEEGFNLDYFFLSQVGGNLKESSTVLSDFFQKREVTSRSGYFFALASGCSCKKRRETFFECGSQVAVDIESTVHTTICFINQNTEKPIHVEGAVHVFTVNSQFFCAPFEVHILLCVIVHPAAKANSIAHDLEFSQDSPLL